MTRPRSSHLSHRFSHSPRFSHRHRTFTLVELLVVIFVLTLLIAVLLPSLSRMRQSAMKAKLMSEERPAMPEQIIEERASTSPAAPALPAAQVQSLDAKIGLTPKLSIGTAEPESIYEATFDATLIVHQTAQAKGNSEIRLPLPPQVISLGDLSLSINGQSSDALTLEHDQLVWRGPLPATPTPVEVKYTAVGRGIYSLQTPPGNIIDHFRIELAANQSDVRMLELSLQPTDSSRGANRTTYVWDYKRLMFGRPISLDVLGIAPIDRLGELGWLGPVSVIAFGIVIGLMSRAYHVGNFDRWMLLLVLGTFTGAYPLMYFAQQFIPLNWAMASAALLVMMIIATRVTSIMGWKLGALGVTLPAATIMTLTLAAAVHPNLQGMLLTVLVLALFVLAMSLAPKMRINPMPQFAA